jgi:hypothetical protein
VSTPLRDLLHPSELLANALADCFAKQRRVLIVGTRAGNLPQWVAEHPQVVQWSSEGPESQRAKAFPEGVAVVLFFKWIGHRNHKRIVDLARETGVFAHPQLLGTGEVRRLLQPLQPVETPTPEAVPPARPTWEGSLFGFVEANYQYATERGHQKTEGERLLRLAYQHGLTTTLASVTNTVGTVHRGIERTREEERLQRTPTPPDVAELLAKPLDAAKVAHLTLAGQTPLPTVPTVPTVAQKPSVAALVAAGATTEAAVDTSLSELLRMLDDAVAVLGLAREQLVGLSAQNKALRGSREALRDKMLALFEGI